MIEEKSVSPAPKEEKYPKHQIEDAANTLARAEEIKEDHELYELAYAHMEKKSGHLKKAMGTSKKPGSLQELKELGNKKAKEDAEEC